MRIKSQFKVLNKFLLNRFKTDYPIYTNKNVVHNLTSNKIVKQISEACCRNKISIFQTTMDLIVKKIPQRFHAFEFSQFSRKSRVLEKYKLTTVKVEDRHEAKWIVT